ncbi:MAG: (d)CMP kinase [Lactobacillus sp.]|nr:(d)CMP kinase [Lactobacillus sp.]
MQIAIDGPASAGKSTVAKIIAQQLNFIYIDTGAMYRAATVIAMRRNLDLDDEDAIVAALNEAGISFKIIDGQQHVLLGQEDVTTEIRTPEVSANVSQVSALPKIREKLVALQRELAGQNNVIMDGRDIGTTVLPDAELKIFLVASARSRAQRRVLDLQQRGIKSDKTVEEIEADIAARDYKDSHREISPLKKADDAIEVDTTEMGIEEVVETIIKLIKEKS